MQSRLEAQKTSPAAYSAMQTVLHVMGGLLVVGFVANLLVRPVAQKYRVRKENERCWHLNRRRESSPSSSARAGEMAENAKKSSIAAILFAWLLVGFRSGGACTTRSSNSMKLFQAQ